MSTASQTPRSARQRKPRQSALARDAFRLAGELTAKNQELRKELEFQIDLLHALARKCQERIAQL